MFKVLCATINVLKTTIAALCTRFSRTPQCPLCVHHDCRFILSITIATSCLPVSLCTTIPAYSTPLLLGSKRETGVRRFRVRLNFVSLSAQWFGAFIQPLLALWNSQSGTTWMLLRASAFLKSLKTKDPPCGCPLVTLFVT